MEIPILDLNRFERGTTDEKELFTDSLGKAFETIGFVSIINHGIQNQLIESLYKNIKNFFSLPLEIKRKYEHIGLHGQRGYTSFGREHAKGSEAPDLKEFFQYGQVVSEDGKGTKYPNNVSVEELQEFDTVFKSAYQAFEKSGGILLRSIALYLDLEEGYFEERITHGNSILRAIHYPPILQEPKTSIRAEQHEDINLITLLVGASADGLEILTKSHKWFPVKSGPGQIVVNVGDMLQRLTNNRLRSTTHRVVNPPRDLWHTSRFSVPFFLHPWQNVSLRCLDGCVTDDNPKQYEDMSAGEYLDERLSEIGLKKP